MDQTSPSVSPPEPSIAPAVEPTRSHLPRLSIAEWGTFAILAAMLAVTNIYTTLLTGWGDGGSIIAVLAAVAVLGAIQRRKPGIETLNLGQTMASAGGSVGFAVSFYAAVKMVNPEFLANEWLFMLMFVGMGIVGTFVGSSVRRYMVGYFFPSGTACAVIQRTVTGTGEEAARPVRLLALWSAISGLLTIPTKITLTKGKAALLHGIPLGYKNLSIGLEPLLYGIGLVVGPRIGLGMLIGALAGQFVILPQVKSAGIDPSMHTTWVRWTAIAVLTIPTFAAILFAYFFRTPAIVPPGFTPGKTQYGPPPSRMFVYGALGLVGVLLTAIGAHQLFGVSWVLTVLTIAVSWPLCVMNGRVTGETDINPVRLVAIVLLTLFATLVSGGAVALLGIAIIGGTLAGMAVDMMQDFRTGYLVNANPSHQTTVQVFGTIAGALVAVPFIFFIDSKIGFGPGTSLPAPGAQIWSAMAQAFTGGAKLSQGLITLIVIVSIVGSGYAFLTVWPRSGAYMPSLFGMGIALLLPFEMSAAIFLGSMMKWGVSVLYQRGKEAAARRVAVQEAGNDTMLVGSAIFAASAVISVLVVLLTELMAKLKLDWFFLAGH